MVVWNHFCTLQPYSHDWRVSKMAYFLGQNQTTMAGSFQGRESTWKPFYAPYHLPIHGTEWLWTIFDHPSHTSISGGDQKWLIFRSKSSNYGRLVPGQGIHLETILCAISPPNTWDSMTLDHFSHILRVGNRYMCHTNTEDMSCLTKNGT